MTLQPITAENNKKTDLPEDMQISESENHPVFIDYNASYVVLIMRVHIATGSPSSICLLLYGRA